MAELALKIEKMEKLRKKSSCGPRSLEYQLLRLHKHLLTLTYSLPVSRVYNQQYQHSSACDSCDSGRGKHGRWLQERPQDKEPKSFLVKLSVGNLRGSYWMTGGEKASRGWRLPPQLVGNRKS